MWEFDKPIRKLYTLFHVELHTRNVSHWWDLETESVLPIFIFEFIRQYSRNGLKKNIHLISCEKKDTSRQSKAKYSFKCRESRIEIELLVEILTFRTPSMERENTYIKSFHWHYEHQIYSILKSYKKVMLTNIWGKYGQYL